MDNSYTIKNNISTVDYVKMLIENANHGADCKCEECMKKKQANPNIDEETAIKETNNNLLTNRYAHEARMKKFSKFSENVKSVLLSECLYKIFNESFGIVVEDNKAVKRSLVNKFIEENGVNNLLSSFRTKTLVLSEFNRLVNKYHKLIVEAADKNDENTFVIDTTIKDAFFDELNDEDIEDITTSIRTRVADAAEEFIQSNIANNVEIKETIKDVQDKINKAKIEEVKESYEMQAKQKINKIRNSKPKNVFGEMVSSMASTVLKTDDLKSVYMEDNKLNLDKIVESCKVMYTFLETVNTAKIVDVNESFIQDVLKGMKTH